MSFLNAKMGKQRVKLGKVHPAPPAIGYYLSVTKEPHKILLVDDDITLCRLLVEFLTRDGFAASAVHSGADALETVKHDGQYDAVVLDIMMPGISGLEVLQSLRSRFSIPIIMLTGRGDDIDRIIGLEMGADDYISKPCNPRELAARLRAVLRRTAEPRDRMTNSVLESHGIRLDIGRREATLAGEPLNLTSAEFNTLALLMQSAGEVLSKELLTEKVLYRKLNAYDRSIDVHISRIRQKLSAHLPATNMIKSIRGAGYQFISDDDADSKRV